MGTDQDFHRSGPLKQTNKSHKTGRHRSKGSIDNALKGRVSAKVISHKHKQQQRKEQRRNQMNQVRKNKRTEAIALKRKLGTQDTAPFLVCILPMHSQIDAQSALNMLEKCDEDAIVERSTAGITYINITRFKQRFAFIIPPVGHGNDLLVLDYLKVSDTTLLLTSAAMGEDDIFDKWGHRIFNMISAQGIPTPIVGLMDLESVNSKRRTQSKTAVQKFISKLLPNEKVMQFDSSFESLNILRRIGGQKKIFLQNQSNRPHLFGDKVEFRSIPDSHEHSGILEVTGFLRGNPLNVNGLVHIPGLGDFQIHQIECLLDPYRLEKRSMETSEIAIFKPNPQLQTTLQFENIPNPFNTDQTWPTEEELQQSSHEEPKKKLIKRIPKGWSEYQAAWIPDVETIENENKYDEDRSSTSEADLCEFMSCEENSSNEEFDKNESDNEEFVDTASEIFDNDENYDRQMDMHEEFDTMKKIKDARVDQMWPDEIDTPQDVPARDRFQKFRGLESFRTSPWDPKENLPNDYARIYQFQNFDQTKRRIISGAKKFEGLQPGTYIKIHINNVSSVKWAAFKSAQHSDNAIVYGVLPHEHQMSVMNVVLKRTPESEVPIKCKEKLIMQCGYRRFVVNPIFSQHTNGNKHKFERYFRPDTIVVATFYAPIQFPPAAVLCFTEKPDTSLELVARGSLLSCNPDRIILKRIVLSGHPIRIHRKSATVRYMFFNKEDVNYFKPVKLRTKCGRVGHIKESLGTHGHMKCYFDGQVRSYDTVFMCLYKRVFPKWTYQQCLISCEDAETMETDSIAN